MKHFFRKCKFFLEGGASGAFCLFQDFDDYADYTDFPAFCLNYFVKIKVNLLLYFIKLINKSTQFYLQKIHPTKHEKISVISLILQKDKRRLRRRPSATALP